MLDVKYCTIFFNDVNVLKIIVNRKISKLNVIKFKSFCSIL